MYSYEDLKALGIEYVLPSSDGRRQGYYRRIARTREKPSLRQAEHRLSFSKTAYETFGQRGVVKTQDDRQIPRNAEIIAKKLTGTGLPRRVPSMQEKLIRLIMENKI